MISTFSGIVASGVAPYQTVLVSGDVDRDNFGKSEVPFQAGVDKGNNETTTGSVDVDWGIKSSLDQEVVDGLDVLVLSGISGTDDSTDTDSVLVDEVDSGLRVDDVAVFRAVNVLLFDIEVARSLLPANLNCTVHDDVGSRGVLALGLALVLPASLHGEGCQHDGL